MNDTPRTEIYVINPHPECVPAEFARELERENQRLKLELLGRPGWIQKEDEIPQEGEWVLHTFAGVRAPKYGLFERGKFWEEKRAFTYPVTHWMRVPFIEPNT